MTRLTFQRRVRHIRVLQGNGQVLRSRTAQTVRPAKRLQDFTKVQLKQRKPKSNNSVQ